VSVSVQCCTIAADEDLHSAVETFGLKNKFWLKLPS